jgi:hypothetical protein
VLEELCEIRKALDAGGAMEPSPGTVAEGKRHAEILERLDELRGHASDQGTGLAAVLMTLNARGWIPKTLADHLRKQKWLW